MAQRNLIGLHVEHVELEAQAIDVRRLQSPGYDLAGFALWDDVAVEVHGDLFTIDDGLEPVTCPNIAALSADQQQRRVIEVLRRFIKPSSKASQRVVTLQSSELHV